MSLPPKKKKTNQALQDLLEDHLECAMSFQFADLNQTKKQVQEIKPYNDKFRHRVVQKGLNLEGICRNQQCSAFEQRVWIPVGMGTFDISYLIHNSQCPACSAEVSYETIKTLGFTRTHFSAEGKQLNPTKTVNFAESEREGKMHIYDGFSEDSKATWAFLRITTRQL